MYILLLLCFAAQFFAVGHYLKIMYPKIGWNTLASKGLCSALFVLTAVIANFASGGNFGSKTMMAAFICSFFGDLFLHSFPKLGNLIVNYALGGISFLAGHIFFVVSFFNKCFQYNPDAPAFSIFEATAIIVLCAVVNILLRVFGLKLKKFTLPVLIYSLALMAMFVKAVSAAILVVSNGGEFFGFSLVAGIILTLGAAMFTASDIVLAADFFSGGKDLAKKKANIILYYSGQMLLALSLCLIEF